jgi:hypothetical protein
MVTVGNAPLAATITNGRKHDSSSPAPRRRQLSLSRLVPGPAAPCTPRRSTSAPHPARQSTHTHASAQPISQSTTRTVGAAARHTQASHGHTTYQRQLRHHHVSSAVRLLLACRPARRIHPEHSTVSGSDALEPSPGIKVNADAGHLAQGIAILDTDCQPRIILRVSL